MSCWFAHLIAVVHLFVSCLISGNSPILLSVFGLYSTNVLNGFRTLEFVLMAYLHSHTQTHRQNVQLPKMLLISTQSHGEFWLSAHFVASLFPGAHSLASVFLFRCGQSKNSSHWTWNISQHFEIFQLYGTSFRLFSITTCKYKSICITVIDVTRVCISNIFFLFVTIF